MIKRPLDKRFAQAVIEGRKFTTIRKNPWPCWKPIMLYHWTDKPYRSKQIDVASIEVEEVLPITITHDTDGGIVFCRDHIDGIPIHKTEGFADAGEMQAWFREVVPVGQTVELSLMRFRLMKKPEPSHHEFPCTECNGNAFIGISDWKGPDGQIIGKHERLCSQCSQKRGIQSPF